MGHRRAGGGLVAPGNSRGTSRSSDRVLQVEGNTVYLEPLNAKLQQTFSYQDPCNAVILYSSLWISTNPPLK